METQQPVWKLVTQLGDANPVEHGGLFVYEDTTGVYPPEAERLLNLDWDSVSEWEVRRFVLENLKLVKDGDNVYLVAASYNPDWSNPLPSYDEWFHKDLAAVAASIGRTLEQMREWFTSTNSKLRALAWEALGDYHGWDNLDSYPRILTSEGEVRERYKGDI